MTKGYYLGSYAIIEYFADNPHVTPYFSAGGMLTRENILEVAYAVAREYSDKDSQQVVDVLWHLQVEPTKEELLSTIQFRKKNSKKKLSYADCLGYCIAKSRGILF